MPTQRPSHDTLKRRKRKVSNYPMARTYYFRSINTAAEYYVICKSNIILIISSLNRYNIIHYAFATRLSPVMVVEVETVAAADTRGMHNDDLNSIERVT